MNQNNKNYLGIWLDHSKAHLIELKNDKTTKLTLLSEFKRQEREDGKGATGSHFGKNSPSNNEYSKHQREKELLSNYYKALADQILKYDEVILFGPTTAKDELFNKVTSDKQFGKVRVHLEPADKMTENQMDAFVKDYFRKK